MFRQASCETALKINQNCHQTSIKLLSNCLGFIWKFPWNFHQTALRFHCCLRFLWWRSCKNCYTCEFLGSAKSIIPVHTCEANHWYLKVNSPCFSLGSWPLWGSALLRWWRDHHLRASMAWSASWEGAFQKWRLRRERNNMMILTMVKTMSQGKVQGTRRIETKQKDKNMPRWRIPCRSKS